MTTNDKEVTFQNENINGSASFAPGCIVNINATVSPKATQASYREALKQINKEVSIPGFRKGRAPEAMIEKNFNKHIDKEWKDLLLNTAFKEILQLIKILPFNDKSVKSASVKSISKENGATISIEYESFPRVPEVAPEVLSIPEFKRDQITEKEINQTLYDLQLDKAEWIDVTDRSPKEGDYVDLDIVAVEEPPKTICHKSRFRIVPESMGTWMRRLVLGMTVGQTAEGMSEKDEGDCKSCEEGKPHEHDNFRPTLCRITLHAIKEPKLPELDDEFAKKYGANDLADLKTKVTVNLNSRADAHLTQQKRWALQEQLVQKYPFDLPLSVTKEQIKAHKQEVINELKSRQVPEAAFDAEAKKIEEGILHRIIRDTSVYFIIHKVAKENHIEVSKDEVMNEWMKQLWYQQVGQNSIDVSQEPADVQANIHSQLLRNKTLDFLLSKVPS